MRAGSCKMLRLSPFEGERIEVRGFPIARNQTANPHPTVSLTKGKTNRIFADKVLFSQLQ